MRLENGKNVRARRKGWARASKQVRFGLEGNGEL